MCYTCLILLLFGLSYNLFSYVFVNYHKQIGTRTCECPPVNVFYNKSVLNYFLKLHVHFGNLSVALCFVCSGFITGFWQIINLLSLLKSKI